MIGMGTMKLHALRMMEGSRINAEVLLDTKRSFWLDARLFPLVRESFRSMNAVLKEMIPGMQIEIRDFGEEIGPEGVRGSRVQLLSCRNGRSIPLHYESEGIKKLLSVLQLLIWSFNHRSATIAIDELDSGVFEYMLGELLRIFSEQGRGQLIFTSHNLRPLETLDKNCIAFTTVNPMNRYVRMKGIMANNNLRDCYFRRILTETDGDALYIYTDNAKLSYAMRTAGESM